MTSRQFNFRERLFGVRCDICGVRVRDRGNVHNHHIDGNHKNNRRENMVWVCPACHIKVSKTQQHGRPAKLLLNNNTAMHMRAQIGAGSATEDLRREVDYGEGTPTMRVNGKAELPWRNWCEAHLRRDEQHRFAKSHAVYGGAEEFGVSPDTTKRYWLKWTSAAGPAMEVPFDGVMYAVWRRVPADLINSEPSVSSEPKSIGEALKQVQEASRS